MACFSVRLSPEVMRQRLFFEEDGVGFEVDGYGLEFVEQVFAEDAVDFLSENAIQIVLILNDDAALFPLVAADFQTDLSPMSFGAGSGFREGDVELAWRGRGSGYFRTEDGGVGAGVKDQDGGLTVDLDGDEDGVEEFGFLEREP
jgi:hypothetical protein